MERKLHAVAQRIISSGGLFHARIIQYLNPLVYYNTVPYDASNAANLKNTRELSGSFIIVFIITFLACGQAGKNRQPARIPPFAPGYNLTRPVIYKMPEILNEISGIAFRNGNADLVYAEQDEEGKVFSFQLGSENLHTTKFAEKGDYEDLQFCNNLMVILRSDGNLYTFPFSETLAKKATHVKVFKGLLPAGEYEGLYADHATSKIYVLCKHCNEKIHISNTGYVLSVTDHGTLMMKGDFTIDVRAIAEKAGDKKVKFEPSALAQNERTGEWFVLSSVNKILVITHPDWTIKEVHRLDPLLYNQPEGIAFDKSENLYISNEKGRTETATILKISLKN